MRRAIFHRRAADVCLQYLVGHAILVQEPGTHRCPVVGARRVEGRGQILVRRGTQYGRQQAQEFTAIGRASAPCLHVHHSHQVI